MSPSINESSDFLNEMITKILDPQLDFPEPLVMSLLDACFKRLQPPFPPEVIENPSTGMIEAFSQRYADCTANALLNLLPEIRSRGLVVNTVSGQAFKLFPHELTEVANAMEAALKRRSDET